MSLESRSTVFCKKRSHQTAAICASASKEQDEGLDGKGLLDHSGAGLRFCMDTCRSVRETRAHCYAGAMPKNTTESSIAMLAEGVT